MHAGDLHPTNQMIDLKKRSCCPFKRWAGNSLTCLASSAGSLRSATFASSIWASNACFSCPTEVSLHFCKEILCFGGLAVGLLRLGLKGLDLGSQLGDPAYACLLGYWGFGFRNSRCAFAILFQDKRNGFGSINDTAVAWKMKLLNNDPELGVRV